MKLSDILGKPRVERSSIQMFAVDSGRWLGVQRTAFMLRQTDPALHAGISVRTIRKLKKGGAICSTVQKE